MIRTLIGIVKTYLTDYPMEVVEVSNGYVQYFPEDHVWRLYKKDGSFDRELSEATSSLSEIASIIGL